MKRCLVAHRSYRSRSRSSLRTLALWPTSSRVSQPAALVALAAFLVLLGNESAPAQSTTPAPRQQVARAAVDMPVVLTRVPAGGTPGELRPGPRAGAAADLDPAVQLVLLAPDGSTRVLTSHFHSASDADVSVDGGRILFAGQAAAGGDWNIYEMDLQSLTTRQVTRNASDCRSPIYTSIYYTITEKEPWEQIAFVSTLARQADERGTGPATSLYTCKLDGSFLQRITYNLSSDLDPAIMADGRLVYAAWHRATFDDGVRGRLVVEGINTDDLVPVRGSLSQGDPRLHFVLGKATKAEKVQIRWPDGSTTLLADVPANQFQSVVKPVR